MCEILTEVVLNLKTEAIDRDLPKVMGGEDCSEWSLEVRISL